MRLLASLVAFCFSASAFAAATPCHIISSGKDGPTVIIKAGDHGAGYAADQLRHWKLAKGRVIILPPAEKSDMLEGLAEPKEQVDLATPALKSAVQVRLVDDLKKLPADTADHAELTLPARAAATTAIVAKLNANLPAKMGECELKTALPDPPDYLFTTRAPDLRISVRAREHRLFAHALLTELGMLDSSVTPELVVDSKAPVRVAIFDGGGSAGLGIPNCLAQLRTQPGTVVTRVAADDIAAGALAQFTVVMFTGGSGGGQAKTLEDGGRQRVTEFVRAGGGYVGICAGSYLACKGFSWGLGILNAKTASSKWQRGRGLVKIELTPDGRQLLGNFEGETACRYGNGPILVPANADDLPAYEPLAFFRTELAENDTPKGIMVNAPAIVRSTCGKGRVLCISPHPEQTEGLEGVIPRAVKWVAGRE
jgi:glutamine amidotransferase-like uncharacterized protein